MKKILKKISLFAFFTLLLVSCKKTETENPQPQQPAAPTVTYHTIKFVADFSGTTTSCNVSYNNQQNQTINQVVTGNHFETILTFKNGDYPTITASALGSGNIITQAEIYSDNVLMASNNSSGANSSSITVQYIIP